VIHCYIEHAITYQLLTFSTIGVVFRIPVCSGLRPKLVPLMSKSAPSRVSISIKLMIMVVLVLIFMIAITLINTQMLFNQSESDVRTHAIKIGDVVKRAAEYSMMRNDYDYLVNIVHNIGLEPGLDGIWVYNMQGEVRIATDSTAIGTRPSLGTPQCIQCHRQNPPRTSLTMEERIRNMYSDSGDRALDVITPIENSPDCSSAYCHVHQSDENLLGFIEIRRSLREADKSARETRTTMLTISALLILLTAILFSIFIQRIILRPIKALMQGTRRIAAMDLDHQIPIRSHDELGLLSLSFNQMTRELQRANDANRRWSETLEDRVHQKTQELERAQAHLMLVDKMASLGKLAGVVAHEINNPIAGILTYAKLSIRNLSDSPSPDQIKDSIENLCVIRDESKRCGDIVNNLLHFSRKSFGKMSDNDLLPIISRSFVLTKHGADTRRITLNQVVTASQTVIHCDPAAIEQMLLVFLINAIEAIPGEGGSITVELQNGEPGFINLIIRDTGSGISPDDLPHVFEPYYTTKDTSQNTGLGLAVAYRIIVDQHHGNISIESKIGTGTQFIIELPIEAQNHTENSAASDQENTHAKE
jgi:two-component system, NtrC family, sensor kinase